MKRINNREGAAQAAPDLLRLSTLIGKVDDDALADVAAGARTLETFGHAVQCAGDGAFDPQEIGAATYWIARKLRADVDKARHLLEVVGDATRSPDKRRWRKL